MMNNDKNYLEMFKQALESGDTKSAAENFVKYNEEVNNKILEMAKSNDSKILAKRGLVRELTNDESKFYDKLIRSVKNEVTNVSVALPVTIVEEVFNDLIQDHPLLDRIDFRNLTYSSRFIVSKESGIAVFGNITSAIVKEIEAEFENIEMTQKKLSAYFLLSEDIVDLGPEWIDSYVRTVLQEAFLGGLEEAVIAGDGNNKPVGMMMDLTSEAGGTYTAKTPVVFTDMDDATTGYLAQIAKMCETEPGEGFNEKTKSFKSVALICNMTTYLTKILPASQYRNHVTGEYTNDNFPFATDVLISNHVPTNRAVLALPERYILAVALDGKGVIQSSDEARFIEDQRVYKVKGYANGRMKDNNDSVVLDVTNLKPFASRVKVVADE